MFVSIFQNYDPALLPEAMKIAKTTQQPNKSIAQSP
jgi:hypothetical protein